MKMILVATIACLMAGCASRGGSGDFPEVSRAQPSGGAYVNLDDLRQYAEGMNKRQLYALLGTPHFGEGMWGVREWNYVFNLRPAIATAPLQCQFQIQFDGAGVAVGHAWQPASCGALLEPPPASPPPPATSVKAPLRLSADALFAFDSAQLSEAGKEALDRLLEGRLDGQLQVSVVGYTDRIGDAAYNMALSQQRAEAVRHYLIQLGVAASAVTAQGRGMADPVVDCEPAERSALVACLAPNRRVEIAGIAGN